MLRYALIFFLLALAAAALGFGGFVAGNLMWVAKLLAIVFVVLFVVSLVTGRTITDPLD